MKIFDVDTDQLLNTFKHEDFPIYDFATNDSTPTSNLVLTTSPDRDTRNWDRRSGKCVGIMSTKSPNFEVNLFNDFTVTVGSHSLVSTFDLRKPNVLVDSLQLYDILDVPVRGLSVSGTKTVCGSRLGVNILSRHPEVIKKFESRVSNSYTVLNTIEDQKNILCLCSDDEFLISGALGKIIKGFSSRNDFLFQESLDYASKLVLFL